MKPEPFLRKRGHELRQHYPTRKSPCSLFGECGGCSYLDISYTDELDLKQRVLQDLFDAHQLNHHVEKTVPSPQELRYRNKITPQFKKLLSQEVVFGVAPFGRKDIIPFKECPIALPQISKNIPEVYQELLKKDLSKYKRGCLTLRSDGEKFAWGGVGKGSLKMDVDQYFVYHDQSTKVHYSLETFFQANSFILPTLFETLKTELNIDKQTHFYDLYGGVGLFSFTLGKQAGYTTLIELEGASTELAEYNKSFHNIENMSILCSAVEKLIPFPENPIPNLRQVAMIDPPRAGLKPEVIDYLYTCPFETLAYLSCNPETQARDLVLFTKKGWRIKSITPFDFFPKSYHIESLAILIPPENN